MKRFSTINPAAGLCGLVLLTAIFISETPAEAETPTKRNLSKENADRNWAQELIESFESVKRSKAGQRKLLQRLKSDPEFAAEWNRQVKANLARLKEKPDEVSPAVDQREHRHELRMIRDAAEEIDRIIQAKLQSEGMTFNPPGSDEHFVRRIYLQAAGRIPTFEETLAFLQDNSQNRRAAIIDDLLLRPDYRMQMFNYLSDMMRIKEMHPLQGDSADYQLWVMKQLAVNRPWNEIVFDLLSARGTLVTNPAVGWMFRDRGMDLDRLANTMTTFMGAAVGCAQCHDHPLEDWTQKDFYQLTAFFGSLDIPAYGAKGFGNSRESKTTAAPSVAFVVHEDDRFLTYPDDWAYDDATPGAKVIPRFPSFEQLIRNEDLSDQTRQQEAFARWMTHPENSQFAATIANRLWRKAFGAGLIEPVTEMDNLGYASNPELMRHLVKLMQQLDFDLMAFQRAIYHTRAFQARTSLTPRQGAEYHFPGPLLRRMTAEQAWDSFVTLHYGSRLNDHIRPRHLEARQYDVFQPGALVDLEFPGSVSNKAAYVPLLEQAADIRLKYKDEWMRVARQVPQFRRASELNLPTPESHFLRQFGQSAKTLADDGTREGTIPQALTIMNGTELQRQVFADRKSHFYQLASAQSDAEAQTDSLYLSVLSRKATAREIQIIEDHDLTIEDLAWLLTNTREFLFVQ